MFLDRDGVINEKAPEGDYVSDWDKFRFLPMAPEAIAELNRSGRTVIVITNQRGIALGRYTQEALADIHQRMSAELAAKAARVDAIYVCPHDKGECECRKPKTGLFRQAFADFPAANSTNSVMIGDSLGDMQAAERCAMRRIFVRGPEATQKPGAAEAERMADDSCDSLWQAVQQIVAIRG